MAANLIIINPTCDETKSLRDTKNTFFSTTPIIAFSLKKIGVCGNICRFSVGLNKLKIKDTTNLYKCIPVSAGRIRKVGLNYYTNISFRDTQKISDTGKQT